MNLVNSIFKAETANDAIPSQDGLVPPGPVLLSLSREG